MFEDYALKVSLTQVRLIAMLCSTTLEYLPETRSAADIIGDSGHVREHGVLVDVRDLQELQRLRKTLSGQDYSLRHLLTQHFDRRTVVAVDRKLALLSEDPIIQEDRLASDRKVRRKRFLPPVDIPVVKIFVFRNERCCIKHTRTNFFVNTENDLVKIIFSLRVAIRKLNS